MHTTSRLALQVPDGTDAESTFPAQDAATLAILDNAAMWGSGTLAAIPTAASTASGTIYYATDTGALMVCAASAWVLLNGDNSAIGAIKYFSGATVPADKDGVQRWHLCDGSALSRTSNAALFTAIGTNWGAGDGSTTFNIPDARGRVLIGVGAGSGLTSRSLAAESGAENVTLSATNLPAHTHGYSGNTGTESASHTHSYQAGVQLQFGFAGGGNTDYGYGPYTATSGTESQNHTHGFSGTTDNGTGGGQQFSIMPPFAAANAIIKVT